MKNLYRYCRLLPIKRSKAKRRSARLEKIIMHRARKRSYNRKMMEDALEEINENIWDKDKNQN